MSNPPSNMKKYIVNDLKEAASIEEYTQAYKGGKQDWHIKIVDHTDEPVPKAEYFMGFLFGGKRSYSRYITDKNGEYVFKNMGKAPSKIHFYAFKDVPKYTFTHATSPEMEPVDITIRLSPVPPFSSSVGAITHSNIEDSLVSEKGDERPTAEMNVALEPKEPSDDWIVTVMDQYDNPISDVTTMIGRETEHINLYLEYMTNENGKVIVKDSGDTPKGVRIYGFKRDYDYGFTTAPAGSEPIRETVVMEEYGPPTSPTPPPTGSPTPPPTGSPTPPPETPTPCPTSTTCLIPRVTTGKIIPRLKGNFLPRVNCIRQLLRCK